MIKNIFDKRVSDEVIERINQLTPDSIGKWGKMDVAQMLAHSNVTYEFIFTDKYQKPNFFTKFMLKMFVKGVVTSDKPYKKDSRTAPAFLIKSDKDFEVEKKRLIDYINQVQQQGESHYDGLESHSFGSLTKTEWNNMFYKHLDHHLTQFGV